LDKLSYEEGRKEKVRLSVGVCTLIGIVLLVETTEGKIMGIKVRTKYVPVESKNG
jgi:hypothetical protein